MRLDFKYNHYELDWAKYGVRRLAAALVCPGLPGRGACAGSFLAFCSVRPRIRAAQTRAGQAPPHESESKLSDSKFPFGQIPLFSGSHDDAFDPPPRVR